ncbi:MULTISPECIES: DUF4266 domain-containing protein [Flavobacterium]|uniref:DUF4266 domain-containing protein n=1 Tax=Flavobacterium suzhouense TaxID=1529638 RepID=A0ABW5NUT2_9FLAO|nr:DUF4266 domain-containing protein [Flavobacterium sp. AG291]RDI10366.1 uncharacterized protein DUF4266 [Flavobacterium sp. AG291]
MRRRIYCLSILVLAGAGSFSCTSVKEYQKNKINDAEMALSNRKVEKTELSFQSYREGSSGANSGKSGGGCGCN